MKYEVFLTSEAEENQQTIYDWYADRSLEAANRWHQTMLEALASLEMDPERYPSAIEASKVSADLRQLMFGSGRRITHRIIFAIRPAGVVVYAIRHVAQVDWDPAKPVQHGG